MLSSTVRSAGWVTILFRAPGPAEMTGGVLKELQSEVKTGKRHRLNLMTV